MLWRKMKRIKGRNAHKKNITTFWWVSKKEWQSVSIHWRCSFCWDIDVATVLQRELICCASSAWKLFTTDLLLAFSLSSLSVHNHIIDVSILREKSTCFTCITETTHQFYKIMKHCPEETSPSQTVKHMLDGSEHFLFHIK